MSTNLFDPHSKYNKEYTNHPPKGSEAEKLAQEYCKAFEEKYGENPNLTDLDYIQDMYWAVREFGLDKAKKYMRDYFMVNDSWLQTQAYPINFFKRKINMVIASQRVGSVSKKKWIVNVLPCGTEVLDENPDVLKDTPYWIKPRVYEDIDGTNNSGRTS